MTSAERRAALEQACEGPGFPGPLSFRAIPGGLAAYAGDRDFATITSAGLAFKLSSAHGRDLLKAGGTMLPPADTALVKSAVVVPESMLADSGVLRAWAIRSAVYAKSLPPARRKRVTR